MEEFVNLIVQAPIVGLFVWFVLRMNKEWREWIAEERATQRLVNERVAATLERQTEHLQRLTDVLVYHDEHVRGTNSEVCGSSLREHRERGTGPFLGEGKR